MDLYHTLPTRSESSTPSSSPCPKKSRKLFTSQITSRPDASHVYINTWGPARARWRITPATTIVLPRLPFVLVFFSFLPITSLRTLCGSTSRGFSRTDRCFKFTLSSFHLSSSLPLKVFRIQWCSSLPSSLLSLSPSFLPFVREVGQSARVIQQPVLEGCEEGAARGALQTRSRSSDGLRVLFIYVSAVFLLRSLDLPRHHPLRRPTDPSDRAFSLSLSFSLFLSFSLSLFLSLSVTPSWPLVSLVFFILIS